MSENVIEYAPQGIGEGITMTRSPAGVSFEIKPSVSRMLWWLAGRGGYFGAVIIVVMWRVIREGDWASLTSPARVVAMAGVSVLFLWEVIAKLVRFFPMTLTVSADQLELRWRTVLNVHALQWERRLVVGVRGDKVRLKNRTSAVRGLVLGIGGTGDVLILPGTRAQMDLLARRVRAELGLGEDEPPFSKIKAPRGCRWTCVVRGGRAVIDIQPRKDVKWWAGVIVAILTAIVARYVMRPPEDGTNPTFVAASVGFMVALGVVAAGIGIERLRRRTIIAVNVTGVAVMETGIISPMNVRFLAAEVQDVGVAEEHGKKGLRIGLVGRPALVILQGKREADLQWLAVVVREALKWTPGAQAATESRTPSGAGESASA